MSNFWLKLNKPFFALAPMADVTDPAFRRMFAKYGKPDVTFTEFVSADGLCSIGKTRLLRDLVYSEIERPIVAQIFGSKPENIEKACEITRELGFDGVDINMGCPDRNVEKQGAGSAMMKNPKLAKEIIEAAKRGAMMGEEGGIPVSVKTRVGYNKVEIDTWIPVILEAKPAALTIHARTRKEMSLVPARWEHVKEVVEMAKESEIAILGNGDVWTRNEGLEKANYCGADGVMVGRGVFGNPWFFNKELSIDEVTLEDRFRVMLEHTALFLELSGDIKSFAVMKKHYKAYVNGFDGAKDFRTALMNSDSYDEIVELVDNFKESHKDLIKKTPKQLQVSSFKLQD
jgi:nifR3 family TIM-barrel protein